MTGAWPGLGCLIFGDGTPPKALVTALVVGTILTLINHGDGLLAGDWPPAAKVALTCFVPYCVTTWGAVTGKRVMRRPSSGKTNRSSAGGATVGAARARLPSHRRAFIFRGAFPDR